MRRGEPLDTSEALRLGTLDLNFLDSLENRSGGGPIGTGFLVKADLRGDLVFLTVPVSLSEGVDPSASTISTTERGLRDSDNPRIGRIEGAVMLPTHSTAVIDTPTVISCISRPRALKTRTFPACVPIAIDVSKPL
jgi:hypothetical protein